MTDFVSTVTITADTAAQAATVLAERLHHDEDYGFEYRVTFDTPVDAMSVSPALKERLDRLVETTDEETLCVLLDSLLAPGRAQD
jgi:hypothetical protein